MSFSSEKFNFGIDKFMNSLGYCAVQVHKVGILFLGVLKIDETSCSMPVGNQSYLVRFVSRQKRVLHSQQKCWHEAYTASVEGIMLASKDYVLLKY